MGQEKNVENQLKNYLPKVGGYVVKVQSGRMLQTFKGRTRAIHMAPAGTPDLIGCVAGRFMAIEVKKDEKEKQRWEAYPLGLTGKRIKYDERTAKQKLRKIEIERAGGLFVLACSIEDVQKALLDAGIIESSATLL